MADFDIALKTVLFHEGGYVDLPYDAGGPTNFGISARTLSAYLKKPVSAKQIEELTLPQATDIYKGIFWYPLNLSAIKNQDLATILFDLCVLSGPAVVVKALQGSLQIFQDGILGQQTIDSINQYIDATWLAIEVIEEMQDHYINLSISDPKRLPSLKGWIHRSQDLLRLVYQSKAKGL